jgi:predicted Ser/Thr protein kinase
MNLEKEAKLAENLLKGKVVDKVWRHRKREIGIEFTDGTRLFIDHTENGLELSVTGGLDDEGGSEKE